MKNRIIISKICYCVTILLLIFMGNQVKAQGLVHTYFFDRDLKQYSMETVSNQDAYVMAGTYGLLGGLGAIHYVHYDPAMGGIVTSKIFYVTQRDLRAVDIVEDGSGYFYITGLLRDNLVSNGKDRILVLKVDISGNIASCQTLESNISSSTGYRNIYPLHSLYMDGLLYICGYVGKEYYTYPNEPYFGGDGSKKAFVLSFDPSSLSVLCNTWDYIITTLNPLQPLPVTDYDMAMRMISINDEVMYVTGSCNTAVRGSVFDEFPSATLSLFIDKNTLGPTLSYGPMTKSFVNPNAWGAANGNGEYGIDLIPDPEGSGGFFVIGNYFSSDAGGTPSAGFKPFPQFYWLTYLDPNNNWDPPTGSWPFFNRIQSSWDYAWMLQALPTENPDHFLLAGMTPHMWYPCYQRNPSSFNNYNPILTEIRPIWTGSSISLNTNWWRFYESNLGTGIVGVNPSNYRDLGGGLSNIAWNPTFATRQRNFGITTDIMLHAPVMNPNNNLLNFKLIRTDQNGVVNDCEHTSTDCEPTYQDAYVVEAIQSTSTGALYSNITPSPAFMSIQANDFDVHELNYNPTADYICDNVYYKTTSNSSVLYEHKISIMPNPASDFISVNLGSGFSGRISVVLQNITGQTSSLVFHGDIEDTGNPIISLPAHLHTGWYIVTITDDHTGKVSQSKLFINK